MDAILALRQSIIDSLSPLFLPVQIFSAIFSIVLLGGIFYLVGRLNTLWKRTWGFLEAAAMSQLDKKRTVRAWQQIVRRLRAGDEPNLKLAMIEADKVLDEILKLSGFKGQAMSDRLKQITPAQLKNIDQIWQAHRLRNRIAHEPNFDLTLSEAEAAIAIYADALRDFGLID